MPEATKAALAMTKLTNSVWSVKQWERNDGIHFRVVDTGMSPAIPNKQQASS
jgi:hypothetical protein